MSFLVVPIQVDALLLKQGCSCIGQDVNFQELPYFNATNQVLMNQDKPFLAESIISQPFKNDSLFLEAGTHLHWTLPDLVTVGKSRNGETIFPAVPNRWYVRKIKDNKPEEWIIESDYIWDAEDKTCPIHALCTIPLDINLNDEETDPEGITLKSGKQPYAYMGRKYTLKEWREINNPKERYWNHIKKDPLTAIGWGSLVFDTFYAHSRSVFGMHDKDLPDDNAGMQNEYSYTVIGWYDREFDTDNFDFIRELTDEISEELKDERYATISGDEFRKIYEERLNAEIVNAGNENLADKKNLYETRNTFCFGYIDMNQRKSSHPKGEHVRIAVANTPAEAISSLLIESAKKDLRTPDRMKEEEKLEALLNFDDLNNQKLDMAARLRELRHEKGFVAHEGLTNWRIVLEDKKTIDNPTDTNKDEDEKPVPELDAETKDLESKLRTAQYRFDLKKNQLNAALDALYLDWSRYMQAMYPTEGQTHEYPDVDAIRFHIKNNSLKNARALKRELGVYPDFKTVKFREEASAIGLDIAELVVAIDKKLAALPVHPKKEYKLKQETGTQYWEALPPSLVLFTDEGNAEDTELLKYSNRLTQAGKKGIFLRLSDTETGKIELKDHKAFSLDGLLQALKEFSKHRPDFGKDNDNKVNEWHTFRVEWKIELFPVALGNQLTKSNSNFDEDFVTKNYTLQEEDTDFTINPALTALSLHNNGSVYTGSSYVTNTIKQSYDKKVQDFLKANSWVLSESEKTKAENKDISKTINEIAKYEKQLQGTALLGLTLMGFNEALIQQKSIIRLAAADPFGFATHKAFANDVAALLNTGQGSSADPLSTFNPLRCGAFRVLAIRIIDTFGRTCNLTPADIVTSTPNRISRKENWVNLSPRLCQQATMSIRWRDSLTKVSKEERLAAEPSTEISKPSPVCGWMLPVYLNQRIEFFDAFGKHLGGITHKGLWENSVFDYGKASSEDRSFIKNVQLSNLIEWILAKTEKNPAFHESFINILRETSNNIVPESRTNPSLMEIIGGTPIAVTQIAINLFIKGTPAFDLDWNAFRMELDTTEDRNTRQFTKVRFPYSIGDFHKYNDGVVAYWGHTGGRLAGPAYFNSAVRARLSFSKAPDKLPLGLEDEPDYRYDTEKDIVTLLLELAVGGNDFYKHEFTRHYVANGSRYWDVIVNAGLIQLYGENALARLAFNQLSSELPAGLEEEQEYRRDAGKGIPALLQELAGTNNILHKYEFIWRYTANGGKYWDVLVNAGWILEDIKRTFEHTGLSGAIEEAEKNFTVLMHPKGILHLTSGILPVKKLRLPEESYKTALRTIELTFLASPVVMPVNELMVSLHQDSRYEWSWLKAEKEKSEAISETNVPVFNRTLQSRHMKKDIFETIWNQYLSEKISNKEAMPAGEAWKQMLRFGFLETALTFESEDFAYFRQDKIEEIQQECQKLNNNNLPETLEVKVKLIKLITSLLPLLTRSISPFETKALTTASQSLQEGWLSIKTSQKTI
jgi:hypothetical protein